MYKLTLAATIVIIFVFLFFPLFILAQDKTAAVKPAAKDEAKENSTSETVFPKVFIDLNAHNFSTTLPFDVRFQIHYKIKAELLEVTGKYKKTSWTKFEDLTTWQKQVDQDETLLFTVPRLSPNTEYKFEFHFKRKLGDSELQDLQNIVQNGFLKFLNNRKATRKNFDLTVADVSNIADDALKQVEGHIKVSGLSVAKGSALASYYSSLTREAINLTDVFERDFVTSLDNIVGNKAYFVGKKAELSALNADPEVKNSSKFQQLIAQVGKLATPGAAADFLTPTERDNYLAAANQVHAILQDASLTNKFSVNAKNKIAALNPELDDKVVTMRGFMEMYISADKTVKPLIDEKALLLAKELARVIYNDVTILGDTKGDFESRAKYYFSLDIGVAGVPAIRKFSPYLGTNIYLRPVNKDRPLLWKDPFWDQMGRRFSFLAGISFLSVAETGKQEDLLAGAMNVIAGGGFRINDGLRINSGVMIFTELDKNPLTPRKKIGNKPFVSVSFDWDINSVFRIMFGHSLPSQP